MESHGARQDSGAEASGPGRDADWPARDLSMLGEEVWAVLGGGGLKGLAHLGAWEAIVEAGVRPRGIVGTSIGALVGAALAAGRGWEELAPLALDLEREDIVRVNRRVAWVNGIREEGVFRGEVLRAYVERVLPAREWDELEIPLQVNAVDLGTGETVWFGPGGRTDVALVDAIHASCSLPVLYPPVEIGGRYFVDGGTADALPLTRAAEMGASGVVAVDAGSGGEIDAGPVVERGLVAIHQRIFGIMSGLRRREQADRWEGPPLLLVRPRLDGYETFDFESVKYFLEEGYRATRAALERGGPEEGRIEVRGGGGEPPSSGPT